MKGRITSKYSLPVVAVAASICLLTAAMVSADSSQLPGEADKFWMGTFFTNIGIWGESKNWSGQGLPEPHETVSYLYGGQSQLNANHVTGGVHAPLGQASGLTSSGAKRTLTLTEFGIVVELDEINDPGSGTDQFDIENLDVIIWEGGDIDVYGRSYETSVAADVELIIETIATSELLGWTCSMGRTRSFLAAHS